MMEGQISSLRRRKRRRRTVLSAVLFFAFLCGCFFLVRYQMRTESFAIAPDAEVLTVKSRVYALKDGVLEGYTSHGKRLFDIGVDGADQLCAAGKYVVAYSQDRLFVIGKNGQLFSKMDTDGKIRSVDCQDQLFSVLVLNDEKTGVVYVFDAQGRQLDEVSTGEFLEGDIITGAGVSGQTLWILTINAEGSMPVSRIYLFNVREQTLLARIAIPEQIVYDVAMDEKSVIAIGTGQILCYNRTGALQWQKAAGGMYEVRKDLEKGHVVLTLHDRESGTYRTLYNYSDFTVAPDAGTTFFQNHRMYYFLGDHLIGYRVSDYMKIRRVQFEGMYSDARALNRNRILLFDGEQWISRLM
ncbi:MAG: hypothetical protein IJJ34_07895 [Clostridia bacterium]|nr:hypothetical protein [Clostridia bacterium]